MAFTRRQFLTHVGRVGGYGAVFMAMQALGHMAHSAGSGKPPVLGGDAGKGVSVVILGAGLAGMTAAYELGKASYDCRILEARNRSGGRVLTLRGGASVREMGSSQQTCKFDDGLYSNVSAARIPSTHRALLGYCKEFGVPLEVFINDNRNAFYQDAAVAGGKPIEARQVHNDSAGHIAELLAKAVNKHALDDKLTGGDRKRLLKFLKKYGDLGGKLSNLSYSGSERPGFSRGSDRSSLGGTERSGFKKLPGAALAKGELRPPLELTTLLKSDFWDWKMHFEKHFQQQATMLQPVGGMDRITQAFEDRVRDRLTLNAEVKQIRKRTKGVRVVYRDRESGKKHALDADYCICTIPLSVLAKIDANFSSKVWGAIEEAWYVPAVKFAWQANRRFWEEDHAIYGGISYVKHKISELWYPCSGFHSAKGTLVGAYALYEDAEEFAQLSPQNRAKLALQGGSLLHPQMAKHVTNPISVAWHRMPFSEGAFVEWEADQRKRAYRTLTKPDGRIYFAGEHMSHLTGWQEGAVLSAHHVVSELNERVNKQKI